MDRPSGDCPEHVEDGPREGECAVAVPLLDLRTRQRLPGGRVGWIQREDATVELCRERLLALDRVDLGEGQPGTDEARLELDCLPKQADACCQPVLLNPNAAEDGVRDGSRRLDQQGRSAPVDRLRRAGPPAPARPPSAGLASVDRSSPVGSRPAEPQRLDVWRALCRPPDGVNGPRPLDREPERRRAAGCGESTWSEDVGDPWRPSHVALWGADGSADRAHSVSSQNGSAPRKTFRVLLEGRSSYGAIIRQKSNRNPKCTARGVLHCVIDLCRTPASSSSGSDRNRRCG